VSGRMTIITNQQDFRPKILVQSVLGFDRGQVIAGGNDAAVEHDEIVFPRRQDNSRLPPATQGYASEKNGANDSGRKREIHDELRSRCYGSYNSCTTKTLVLGSFLTTRNKFVHYTPLRLRRASTLENLPG
jgi:hypothetical protein